MKETMTLNKPRRWMWQWLSEHTAATLALTSACSFTRISRQTAPCVEAAAQCNGVWNTQTDTQHVAGWFSSNALVSINKVTLHQAKLLHEWVTFYGWVTISVCNSHQGQLSLLHSCSRHRTRVQKAELTSVAVTRWLPWIDCISGCCQFIL